MDERPQTDGLDGVHSRVVDGLFERSSLVEQVLLSDDWPGDETFLDPDEMAETYWHLAEQDDVSTQPFEVHITNGPQNSEFI